MITNDKILWKEVFSYESKLEIAEELGVSSQSIENMLSQLRKKGVIVNNRLTPAFIPNMQHDLKNFELVINFKIMDEK